MENKKLSKQWEEKYTNLFFKLNNYLGDTNNLLRYQSAQNCRCAGCYEWVILDYWNEKVILFSADSLEDLVAELPEKS